MKILLIVTSLLILSIASSAQAQSFQFQNYRAIYTLRYDGIPFGRSITTLNIDGENHYKLCIENRTTVFFAHGNVTECSQGIIKPHTVIPLSYDYHYLHNQNHENIHIDFDWKNKIALMTTKNTTWHIDIPENTQDKISYQLLLRRGVSQGQHIFSFPVADGGKLKNYSFTVVRQQESGIKLERAPISNKENVSLWIRPDLDFLVSKVEQSKHIADVGTADLISYRPLDSHV